MLKTYIVQWSVSVEQHNPAALLQKSIDHKMKEFISFGHSSLLHYYPQVSSINADKRGACFIACVLLQLYHPTKGTLKKLCHTSRGMGGGHESKYPP